MKTKQLKKLLTVLDKSMMRNGYNFPLTIGHLRNIVALAAQQPTKFHGVPSTSYTELTVEEKINFHLLIANKLETDGDVDQSRA